MVSDGEALFAAIVAAPDEDTPRLAYADYVEENNDPDRAEFIRCQVEATNSDDLKQRAARVRAEELLTRHRAEWERQLREEFGVTEMEWSRGFVVGIHIPSNEFLANAEKIVKAAPLITALNLECSGISHEWAVTAIANSPYLEKVNKLSLGYNGMGNAEAEVIANSPHLESLTSLSLMSNCIETAGAVAIANSPHLANLTRLDLSGNFIGNTGAAAIANSPHLVNLTSLNLSGSNICDAGAEAIANSPHSAKLCTLNLHGNYIRTAGAVAIANTPHCKNLTTLDLGYNHIGDAGATTIANSPHLAKVTTLNLASSSIGNAGVAELLSSKLTSQAKVSALRSINLHHLADQLIEDREGERTR